MLLSKINEKRIQKFHDFLNKCSESLNNILPITWINKTEKEWIGEFKSKKDLYEIKIIKITSDEITENDKVYITKFGIKNGESINYNKQKDDDTFRSLSVLGTVKDVLKKFINEISPNSLSFTSSDDDPTRLKLYEKFCKDVSNDLYFYFYHLYEDTPIFIICENNFNLLKIKDLYITLRRRFQLI